LNFGQEEILNLLTISSSTRNFAHRSKSKPNQLKVKEVNEQAQLNGEIESNVNDLSLSRRNSRMSTNMAAKRPIKKIKKKAGFKLFLRSYFFKLTGFLSSPCIIFYYDTVVVFIF
jgi:hypothetical protein